MAKTIATIGGVALAPGISKNRRWYTRDHIAGAVASAQERLARGEQPMVMLSHHEAGDDSLRIAAALRAVSLTEDSRIRWAADIPDTTAGREIAALADTSDGQPAFLEGVSIRGRWTGTVRKVKAPDGELAEQGQGLELEGLDFTHKPGVPEARIDAFAWAKDGATETTERVLITESVQEARVTAITEESAPSAQASGAGTLLDVAQVAETLRTLIPARPLAEADTPAMSKRGSGTTGSGRVWADPGYQADKKQRYDITTKAVAKTAWSYINQQSKAAKYTGAQLKRIKGRIKAALKKFGVQVTDEGWTIDPAVEVTEALAEYAGMDSGEAGSFSIEASNGPICVRISSWCVDPADLEIILRATAAAASDALKSIDPDMDADIDLPGVGPDSDTDGDGGESTEDDGLTEATADPAPDPAAVNHGSKEPVMAATAAQDAGQALAEAQIPVSDGDPGPTGVRTGTNDLNNNNMARNADDDVAGNSFEQFLQSMIDLICRQALADGKMNPAYTQLAAKLAASQALGMSGPAASASVALQGAGSVPAPPVSAESAPAGQVRETEAQMIERIVTARLAAAAPAPVQETAEQRIERLVNERLAAEKAALTESGQGPSRKGLVPGVRESSAANTDYSQIPADWPQKDLKDYTPAEWKQYVEPMVAGAVFGDRGARQPA